VIRKTGGVSTLAVIDGVRAALKDIKKVLPGRLDQGRCSISRYSSRRRCTACC
jgi:multidrug efflux pump subunit AcrB